MKKIGIMGLVLCVLFALSCSSGQDAYLLQLNEGDTFSAVFKNYRETLQKKTEFYVKNDQSFDMGYTFTVTSVENGVYSMDVNYTSINIDMMGTGERLSFDSANPEKYVGTIFYPYKELIGMGFSMTVGKDGKVVDIQGFDTMLEDLRRAFRVLPREENEIIIEELDLYFGPEKFTEEFERFFIFLPGKKVAQGDSWEKSYSVSTEIPLDITTTYTLHDVTDDSYIITFKSDVAAPADQVGKDFGFYDIIYEVAGTGEGELTVAKDSFWVSKYGGLTNLDGSMSLRDPNEGDKTITIPIKIEMRFGIQ